MFLQSIFLLLLVFVGTAIAAKTLTRCDDYCGHAPEPFTKRFDNKYHVAIPVVEFSREGYKIRKVFG